MYKVVYGSDGPVENTTYDDDVALIVFDNKDGYRTLIAEGAGDDPDANAHMIVSALNALAESSDNED